MDVGTRTRTTTTTSSTTTKTHYEILGVSSVATYEQIKVAFHRLARIHHPDKAMTIPTINPPRPLDTITCQDSIIPVGQPCDPSNEDDADVRPSHPNHVEEDDKMDFLKIQEAWYILRDEHRRIEYTDRLNQTSLQTKVKHGGTIHLDWNEVEEAYDEDTEQIIYVYDCRCGEEVIFLPHDLNSSTTTTTTTTTVECSGCCFVYELPNRPS